MLLILYGSAIAGAGIHLLVQSIPLAAAYLAVILGPLAMVAAFQGARGIWLCIAIAFYFVYLVSQGRRLHRQYWQQLEDNRQLSIRAHQDSLTGLSNRLAFCEMIAATVAAARDAGKSVPLLYIDMDGFKQINDHFSHRVGDLFLCEIASRLRACCSPIGVPFRLGGDEFTILLPEGTTAQAAALFARRVLSKIQELMIIDGHHLSASASVGVSIYPDDCRDEHDLLRTADQAMYAAKALSKGTHQVFRDARRSSRFIPNDLARDMRETIDTAGFEMHYQPQVDHRGQLVGFEALLRWNHPSLGNIPPLEFIPLAEETGLIVPLGFWILRQVCVQGKTWHAEGHTPIPISVNVSPVQLGKPDFVESLFLIVQETGFPSKMLTLEITESTLLNNHESVLSQLNRIRSRGIKIAIDDFGTGYSSLSRIQELPIDFLKLDRTFISAIHSRGDRAPIVEAVLAMARSLRLHVVAEGIEMPEQFEVLSRMGCEVFQGYYFGKAAEASAAHRFCHTVENPQPHEKELLLARSL